MHQYIVINYKSGPICQDTTKYGRRLIEGSRFTNFMMSQEHISDYSVLEFKTIQAELQLVAVGDPVMAPFPIRVSIRGCIMSVSTIRDMEVEGCLLWNTWKVKTAVVRGSLFLLLVSNVLRSGF